MAELGGAEPAGRDSQGIHEVELLGTDMERATFVRATEELMMARASLLAKRRLTRSERRIVRWRMWTMNEILAWWQREAEKKFDRRGNKRRGRQDGGMPGKRVCRRVGDQGSQGGGGGY